MEEGFKKVYVDRIVFTNKEGLYHNENGPAVEWYDGDKEWWIMGKKVSIEEFLLFKRKQVLNELFKKDAGTDTRKP